MADGLLGKCKSCTKNDAKIYRMNTDKRSTQVIPESKECPGCKEVKDESCFGRNKTSRTGLKSHCRTCHNKNRVYRYHSDPEAKQREIDYARNRYQTDPVYRAKRIRGGVIRARKRRKTQSARNKLHGSISTAVLKSLKGAGKGGSWTTILGYNADDLQKHLESLFQPGMTWENHGFYGWHIDHIRPMVSFDFQTTEDEDFHKCWAMSNLQPLWAKENMTKGAKYCES